MKNNSRDWILIAKQVSANPFVKIPCPDCADNYLQIQIVPWPGEEQKVDVHMFCASCDSKNTMTKQVEEVFAIPSDSIDK